ncbi:MAG: hypothetical protein NTZ17_01700 [Phycisphaerae bacterium]|nr:hypothetical protein [Phycisphaerae bacterium]
MKGQMKAIQRGLFTAVLVLVTAGLPARGQYAGGSGTAADPYLIATAAQLNAIGLHPEHSAKHFRLTADIDMKDLGATPVNLISTFQGVFDGNDHTIANLIYRVKDEDSPPASSYVVDIGLFRLVTGVDALVQNLGLIEPDVQPDPTCTKWMIDSVGALVGGLGQGWVRNCYVKGGHVHGRNEVGGLVGSCGSYAAVSESWSSAEVSGNGFVGGLIGFVGWASIWSCHAGGCVSGVVDVGGLVGFLYPDSTIEDCFTTGTVSGSQAGGLVGDLEQGSVSRCSSTASLSGSFSLGGLVGVNHGLISTSWAGGEIAGGTTVGGLVGSNIVGDGIMVPYFDTQVTDSYATGAVRGDRVVGGLIGSNEGMLLRCYSTGAVTKSGGVPASDPKSSAGGLVGNDKSVSKWDILGCFWDTTTSGLNKSAGGTGKTTAEMQDVAIYLAAGWDFVGETANGAEDLWRMSDEGPSYPKLAWEHAPDPNAGH